ncbi:STAS domain-containing protein [Sorangium sp. So ce1389]|uniref:STAS domain-containing protein n=1 Tax=Sorangium sp. So ce1389 TaxID=3133336 RepID=UPI003F605D79
MTRWLTQVRPFPSWPRRGDGMSHEHAAPASGRRRARDGPSSGGSTHGAPSRSWRGCSEGVASEGTTIVILDVTGVDTMDTEAANGLIRAAHAVRLLGARVLITGIQPAMAHVLVQLGVDLQGIATYGTLRSGIAAAMSAR